MTFDAGSISSTLSLNTDPFAMGMLRANAIAAVFPQTVTNFLANPLLGVIDLAKRAAGSVVSMFQEMAAEGDDMGDLAASIGVAVDKLTAMGRVAELAGGSIDGVADAYRFLGKNIGEAMQDAEGSVAKTFRRIGVAALDAAGKSRPLEEVMLDVADAIAKMPEGAERTNLAMELLGRSGTSMIPVLSQGSAALREQMEQMRRYGVVVSEEARKSADAWQDGMGEMALARRGLQRAIAEPLIDTALPYLNRLLVWTRTNQPLIRTEIQLTFDRIERGMNALGPVFKFLEDNWREIAAVAGGAAAYMAGPLVVGAIVTIGPALLAVINPINMVKAAVASLMIVINPLAGVTNLVRLGLAAFVATAIAAPEKLGPLKGAFEVVVATGQRLYDTFNDRIAPAIGRMLTTAFAKLQPYLPSTAQMIGLVENAFNRVASFVESRVIPAIGSGLESAFAWIGPKIPSVIAAFGLVLDTFRSVGAWILGTGVPAVGSAFASAWGAMQSAAAAVSPVIQQVYGVIAGCVDWIMATAVPAIEEHFANTWRTLGPVVGAMGDWMSMVWNDIFKPVIAWVTDTAAPAVGNVMSTAINALKPILLGIGSMVYGVYGLALGVLSWATPAIQFLTGVVRTAAGMFGWWWKNVTEPFVSWVWSAVKPLFQWIGDTIGWVLSKIGQAMQYLGKLINITDEAAAAANQLPAPPETPVLPAPNAPAAADAGSPANGGGLLPPLDWERRKADAAGWIQQGADNAAATSGAIKELLDGLKRDAAATIDVVAPPVAPSGPQPLFQLPAPAADPKSAETAATASRIDSKTEAMVRLLSDLLVEIKAINKKTLATEGEGF